MMSSPHPPPSRILAEIRSLDDLNCDSFQNIFHHHFNNKELMVKRLPNDDDSGGGGSLEHLTGNNDFYNSDIRMLRIGIIRDPDDIDEVDEETSEEEDVEHLNVVIKVPVRSPFARTMQKLARPFLKEYLW